MRLKYRLMNEEGEGEGGSPGGQPATGGTPTAMPGKGQPADVKATWPDNWRDVWAKGDEKKLNYLSRYTDPEAALNAGWNANNAIRSGEYKAVKPFPDKGTPEEQNAWRKDNGIPDAPDKYDLKFDNGLVIGDQDKPFVEEFLKTAHAKNLPNSAVKDVLGWYYQNQEQQAQAQAEKDRELALNAQEALRTDWGGNYKENFSRVQGLLDTAPQELKDKMLNSRLSDGTPMFSDPEAIKWLAGLALEINPATTLVPNHGGNLDGAIDSEIQAIEGKMRTNRTEYNKDENLQKRYRDLLTAREKMQRKAG